jgi:hypothetical protein
MEIVYVYQKPRKDFGRPAKFTDFHAEELAETVPEPDRVISRILSAPQARPQRPIQATRRDARARVRDREGNTEVIGFDAAEWYASLASMPVRSTSVLTCDDG